MKLTAAERKAKRAYKKMHKQHKKELKKLVKIDAEWDWGFLHDLVITKPNDTEINSAFEAAMADDLLASSAEANFILPTTRNGVSISWKLEESDYAYIKGTRVYVTRPKAGSNDEVLKFTAIVYKNRALINKKVQKGLNNIVHESFEIDEPLVGWED